MPIGNAMTIMPIIAAATSGVSGDRAGLASGLISTSQQMGGALGLAILSGVAADVTANSAQFGKIESLVMGFDRAFFVAVFFMLFAAVLAITVIKQKKVPAKHEQQASVQHQVSFE
jgi:MFS family permease